MIICRRQKLFTVTAAVAALVMVFEPYSTALAFRGGGAVGHGNGNVNHNFNGNVNRNLNVNHNANVNRNINANVNRNVNVNHNINANVNRNVNVNRNINANVNRNVNVDRNVVRAGSWVRPGNYWWRPGGAIAAGAAIGFVTAATAVAWAGAAPGPNMCWYYTDASQTQGFWDACP